MVISQIQTKFTSQLNPSKICSFETEFVDKPTYTLIHSAARFWFFRRGRGKIIINGIEYEIRRNVLVSIMPWDITFISCVEETLEFYKIAYNMSFINLNLRTIYNPTSNSMSLFNDIGNSPVSYLNDKMSHSIFECFNEIKEELGEESLGNKEEKYLSDSYVISIIIRILVLFTRSVKTVEIKVSENKELNIINDIFRYIYSHLQEKITLERLAKLFYMSESTIANYLQLNVGFNFSELLNEMRLSKSLDLLMYSDMSLQEISANVGYSDASHFIKSFEAKEGVTPKEFKIAYSKNKDFNKIREKNLGFRLIDYIHYNYKNDKISSIRTAKLFGISASELNKILLYQVEKTFDDYLDYVRVSKASELLITTNQSITEIAIEVGYNTSRTFQRKFMNIFKTTPGNFRKNVKYQNQEGKIV